LVFAAFLVNGLLICVTVIAAIIVFARQSDDSGMGVFALAMSTVVPSILAWLVSAIRAFLRPRDREVQLGAALATGHIFLWLLLIALGNFSGISHPPGWLIATPMVGTACYGVAATWLAARWFLVRRRRFAVQAGA
jgi:hypothetical protein